MENAVSLTDVTETFGATRAVDGLTLAICLTGGLLIWWRGADLTGTFTLI
ncbi:hypothetical protein [Streptosporangium sp. NPDC087985]